MGPEIGQKLDPVRPVIGLALIAIKEKSFRVVIPEDAAKIFPYRRIIELSSLFD